MEMLGWEVAEQNLAWSEDALEDEQDNRKAQVENCMRCSYEVRVPVINHVLTKLTATNFQHHQRQCGSSLL